MPNLTKPRRRKAIDFERIDRELDALANATTTRHIVYTIPQANHPTGTPAEANSVSLKEKKPLMYKDAYEGSRQLDGCVPETGSEASTSEENKTPDKTAIWREQHDYDSPFEKGKSVREVIKSILEAKQA